MENIIIIVILTAIVSAVCAYLYRAKKRGKKCIGCPHCDKCHGHCTPEDEQ